MTNTTSEWLADAALADFVRCLDSDRIFTCREAAEASADAIDSDWWASVCLALSEACADELSKRNEHSVDPADIAALVDGDDPDDYDADNDEWTRND